MRMLLCALVCIATSSASAIPITVTATGTIYDGFDTTNVFGLGTGSLFGRSVNAVWTFDSDDAPPDYYGEMDPTVRWYVAGGKWIFGRVSIDGGPGALLDFETDIPSTGSTYLSIQDSPTRDHYGVSAHGFPAARESLTFHSEALIFEFEDDVVTGVEPGIELSWMDDDPSDFGRGFFELRDRDVSTAPLVYGYYVVTSLKAAAMQIPEPSTVILLLTGLIGGAIRFVRPREPIR
jgi:hypothetical protein